jgi:hypothetical protein
VQYPLRMAATLSRTPSLIVLPVDYGLDVPAIAEELGARWLRPDTQGDDVHRRPGSPQAQGAR